jgi:hypothetical protein
LSKKSSAWEHFYNFDRPHGGFKGKQEGAEVILGGERNQKKGLSEDR